MIELILNNKPLFAFIAASILGWVGVGAYYWLRAQKTKRRAQLRARRDRSKDFVNLIP